MKTIVYLVESGRDDPEFEALLSSKQAALAMLADNKPADAYGNDWLVRAIEIDGGIVGTADWGPAGSWADVPREWVIRGDLP